MREHEALKPEDVGDFIFVCQPCFDLHYRNMWLGLRVKLGTCQFCKRHTLVDKIPNVGHLEARE
jgi:hypothetical protein